MDERIETVNDLIKKVMKKEKAIIREQNLVEDLGFSSIQFIELISLVESKYDVIIPIQKLQTVKKVADLYNAVMDLESFCRI